MRTRLRPIVSVIQVSLVGMPRRLGSSLVVLVGTAGVVAVAVSILAMSTGLSRTLQNSADPSRAVVLCAGASAELVSSFTRNVASIVASAPGVKRDEAGVALSSPEVLVLVTLLRGGDGIETSAPLRGVDPEFFSVRPSLKVVEGRMFRPGLNEFIVGRSARRLYRGLEIGSRLRLRGTEWTAVGMFESADSHDSELVGDKEMVMSAYHRVTYQSVTVRLDAPNSYAAFKASLESNPEAQLDVLTESEFLDLQSSTTGVLVSTLAYVVGGIMLIGVLFAATNTMHAAVSARRSEIAVLRAIGFSKGSVMLSVFAEALLLCLTGGLIGAIAAWLLFNGSSVSTVTANESGVAGQLLFDLAVTPSLAATAIACACGVGLLGAWVPAMQAARLPIATALRA